MSVIEPFYMEDRESAHIRPRVEPDRRRHKRIAIHCLGRFMRSDKSEYPCKLLDVSVGGAALETPEAVHAGEHVIVYFEELGRLDGPIVRVLDNGFAMQIQATAHKRERLVAQLTWLANRKALGIPEARRHERIIPAKLDSHLVLPNGSQVECHILDVSISGASIAVDVHPPLGSEVFLGRLRAKVVRLHEQGIGLQFLDIQNPMAIRRHFG